MLEIEILMELANQAKTPEEAIAVLEITPGPFLLPVTAIVRGKFWYLHAHRNEGESSNKILRWYYKAMEQEPAILAPDARTRFYVRLAEALRRMIITPSPFPRGQEITVYRGVGRAELDNLRKVGPSALGIWWTPSKKMALHYAMNQHASIKTGYLLQSIIKSEHIKQYMGPLKDGLHDEITILIPEDIPGFTYKVIPLNT